MATTRQNFPAGAGDAGKSFVYDFATDRMVLTAIVKSGDLVVNVKDAPYGATGVGVADDSTAINAAIAACNTAGGGVVFFPPGNYLANVTFPTTTANITLRGAGKTATRLFTNSSASVIEGTTASTSGVNVVIEDLTIDANYLGNKGVDIGNMNRDWTIRRCLLKNAVQDCIFAFGMRGLKVQDSDFRRDDGQPLTHGINLGEGGAGARIERCTFDWMQTAVVIPYDDVPYYNPEVSDCQIDGHWWQLPTAVTNSGGTVTYTSTTLVDSSAPFAALAGAYTSLTRTARVLVPAASGSGGTVTYPFGGTRLVDTGQTFTGVPHGWIVRTSTKWCIVERLQGTTLYLGQWYLNGATTWGTKTTGPAAGTAYTLYEVIHGRVIGMTSTTLTINVGWSRFATGAAVTPSAGALYELLVPHNNLEGVRFTSGTHAGSISRNTIEATYVEEIFNFGSGTRIIGNNVRFGQDNGITLESQGTVDGTGCVVTGNHVTGQGVNGIYVFSNENVVAGNTIESCVLGQYAAYVGNASTCGIAVLGSRNNVGNNKITNNPTHGWAATSALATHGIIVSGGGVDNEIVDNTCTGFPGGAVKIDLTAGARNTIRDNYGGDVVLVPGSSAAPAEYDVGVDFPGVGANYYSTPSTAAYDPAKFEIIFKAVRPVATGAYQTVMAKSSTAGPSGWFLWIHLTSGRLYLVNSNGTAFFLYLSTVDPPGSVGEVRWYKVAFDNNNGSNSVTTFYSSPDGVVWTQYDQVTAATFTPGTTAFDLTVGADHVTGTPYLGRIYEVTLNSSSGAPIARWDAEKVTPSTYQDPVGSSHPVWTQHHT